MKKFVSSLLCSVIAMSIVLSQSIFDSGRSIFNDSSVVNDDRDIIDSNKSIIDENQSVINEDISVFNKNANINHDFELGAESSFYDINQSVCIPSKEEFYEYSYSGNYGKWLKTMADASPSERTKFVQYFSDWQWSGQKEDFFSYSSSRSEQEWQLSHCYDKAIKKFGVGTAIIATTWIVSFAVPGGTIYQVAIISIAKATTVGALSGGAVGAVSSAGIAYLQGKRGDELVYETVKGAADGYLIGAVTGLVSGTVSTVKMIKDAPKFTGATGDVKTVLNGKVYDAKGKEIGKFLGEKTEINGRSIINSGKAGTKSPSGIMYKTFLADDGAGNFFTVTNPDFTPVKIVDKVYKVPKKFWNDPQKAINWCKQEYIKDLQSPNVEQILGISKKEAALRLQFEKGLNVKDASFLKANGISQKQAAEFLSRYDGGAWHHLPSSGDMIYVPKNHYQMAPHTGGDSFWGSKAAAAAGGEMEW